jgi:hypothetical protein
MKRPDTWIALVGGCAAGLLVGFLAASAIFNDAPASAAQASLEANRAAPVPPSGASTRGEESSAERSAAADVPHGEELQKAVVSSLRMPRPLDQAQLLSVIQNLRKEDFPAVLEVLRKAKTSIHTSSLDGQGPLAWIVFWQRFGELDPQAAMATALQCGDLQYADRNLLEKHLFTGIARSDPLLAAKIFLEHPEISNREKAAEGLIHAWAGKDPAAALIWAREHLADEAFIRVTYAATWGAANAQSEYPDVARAITVSKTIPEAFQEPSLRALKDMVYKRAYVSTDDSLAAVSFTREIGKRDPMFESAVITKLISSDPAAAARYFTQPLADGSPNLPQISLVAKIWAQRDFKAAEAWANEQKGASYFSEVAKVIEEIALKRGNQEASSQGR